MLLFLSPFIFRFVHRRDLIRHGWQKAVFCILSVVMGMYHEIPSFIIIIISAILVVLIAKMKKEKKIGWLVAAVVCVAVGYTLLLLMPVEMGAKQAKFELGVLLSNFLRITKLLRTHTLPLMLVWQCSFLWGALPELQRNG